MDKKEVKEAKVPVKGGKRVLKGSTKLGETKLMIKWG
jgi:hypothetical protein